MLLFLTQMERVIKPARIFFKSDCVGENLSEFAENIKETTRKS